MMTIKVIQHFLEKEERQSGCPKTHVIGGKNIEYKHVCYEGRKDFIEKYNIEKVPGAGKGYVFGVPQANWFEKEDELGEGQFLSIHYEDGEDYNSVVCQNSTVYIMNGGQTVDKINI